MAFTVNLKSIDGYFTGFCRPISSMESAHILNTPGQSTSSLVPLNFGPSYWGDAVSEYTNYYVGAITHLPNAGDNPLGNFINYLIDNGYTSAQNFLVVAAFPIVNNGVDTGTQLCICAYGRTDLQGAMRYAIIKRTRIQSGWNYTIVSGSWSDVLLSNGFTDFGLMAGQLTLKGNLYYAFGFASHGNGSGQTQKWTSAPLWGDTTTAFNTLMGGGIPGEKTSPEFGPGSAPGGGYNEDSEKKGTFDNTSDIITPSSKPTLSPLKAKFFHAYVVTEASTYYLADAMFPTFDWSTTDLVTMAGELGQVLFYNKQMDYILDLLILPIAVPHTDWEHIRVGGKELKTVIEGTDYWINGQPATDCYVDIDCGAIAIEEYWANFLDFAGTRFKLFLPYVGYVDIQPEYINGGTLGVKYRFNIIDGSFVVYVMSTSGQSELEESMIGQYAGVAAVHVPLQSQDFSNKISGLISSIGTVAAGAASGGIGAAAAAGAGANAANTLVQKPGTTHANGYNASSGFLSHREPYLIIERQVSQFSEKYMEEVGLPLNVMRTLGSMTGLTKCEAAHLDTIPCTVEGKEKISQLLADGIIL